MSVEYSNIDPNLLIFEGNQYNHLNDVLVVKTKRLMDLLNLHDTYIPDGDSVTSGGYHNSKKIFQEQKEEEDLLSNDNSKNPTFVEKYGISLKKLSFGFGEVDPNVLLPAVLDDIKSLLPLVLRPFGDTRVESMPSYTTLVALKPMMEHLIGLGKPLVYDVPFERREDTGIILMHASFTFEEVATLFPIFHSLLFCGRLSNGAGHAGLQLKKGFTAGLFLKAPERQQIAVLRRNRQVQILVDEMWKKGDCYSVDADFKAKWEKWMDFNGFCDREAKGSLIRDLVRFCCNNCNVAIVVEDRDSAAIAFGLAQVGLCRIEMLNMGPTGGVTVFGRNEHQLEALRFEPSLRMKSYVTYSYNQRRGMFDICGVPAESESGLMNWLDNQIDETYLLGIANGDPPGTVILTPEFTLLARTGLMKCLGSEIENIAVAVSQRCTSCNGQCVSKIYSTEELGESKDVCITVLLLNTLLTIYIGGVLLKGGMEIDRCSSSSELDITLKALRKLQEAPKYGLGALLASWFILRTGNDAPHPDEGYVLGIEMEGKVHGLRYAIKPVDVGLPLVSFRGHLKDGRHSCACLVFEPCYQSNDIMMEGANTRILSEQGPDIELKQTLYIYSRATYIAVEALLVFSDTHFIEVQLGDVIAYAKINTDVL